MDNRRIIQRSLDYIEDHLETEITAAELAAQAGFSLFHYYRLFQQETGMPVMQFILRRRLLHGVYAMKQGRTRIDAALLYGFDTYSGFYKAFCREFGCTPTDYLNSCRTKRPYRIELSKEAHMTVTHKRAAQILKFWNLEAAAITDIYYEGTGTKNEHACYVDTDFVLKYTQDLQKLTRHIELAKAIHAVGLLAATPVPTIDGQEFIHDGQLYFCLTRRLPGEQLVSSSFYHGDPSLAQFLGEIIGRLHLALVTVKADVQEANLLARLRDWALPLARQAMNLPDDFCERFLSAFSSLYPTLPRQIIHRDPHPGNAICSGDCWGFIDFELTEHNLRIYDPCYAATAILSECFSRDNEAWLTIYRNIIRGYDSVVSLTDAERAAIPYVILANQFVCVAWFSTQDKYKELFQTNKEMTAWLIHQFEEGTLT